jgi:hypothetical protein
VLLVVELPPARAAGLARVVATPLQLGPRAPGRDQVAKHRADQDQEKRRAGEPLIERVRLLLEGQRDQGEEGGAGAVSMCRHER